MGIPTEFLKTISPDMHNWEPDWQVFCGHCGLRLAEERMVRRQYMMELDICLCRQCCIHEGIPERAVVSRIFRTFCSSQAVSVLALP